MGETSIAWAHYTFNPWWGCLEVSPGCANCYAKAWDRRMGGSHWGKDQQRRTFGEKHWREPMKWNRLAEQTGERKRVFCASMADIFDDAAPEGERERIWPLIQATPSLDWMLLTKRPENIPSMLPADWDRGYSNAWMGCTVEDNERRSRIYDLLLVPAKIHWLSVEPCLEAVDLRSHLKGIDLVIIGGESGPKARPFDLRWARGLRDQCRAEGTSVFVKQLGSRPTGVAPVWLEAIRDKKGETMTEWPPDLRIREMPGRVLDGVVHDGYPDAVR